MTLASLALAAGLAGAVPLAGAQDAIEIVPLASISYPGVLNPWLPAPAQGTPVTVTGILRLPDGAERVPAVVLAHGCSGISDAETDLARRLRDRGYATMIVNSFTGRGVPQVCRGTHEVHVAAVVTDIYRALAALAAHPRIDGRRVAVLGLSFGGRAALWAARERFRERYGMPSQRFVAHLALYPAGCMVRLADDASLHDAPVRIFHGEADDWTPIVSCRELVARLRAGGNDAELVAYAGAHHAFVNPSLPQRRYEGVINLGACAFEERGGAIVDRHGRAAGYDSACVTRTVTVGYDAAAHALALRDVQRYLDGLPNSR